MSGRWCHNPIRILIRTTLCNLTRVSRDLGQTPACEVGYSPGSAICQRSTSTGSWRPKLVTSTRTSPSGVTASTAPSLLANGPAVIVT